MVSLLSETPSRSKFATVSPILSMVTRRSTASSLSVVISIRSSRVLISVHTRDAISGPIRGSPSAEMKVLRGIDLLASNSSRILLADFSAILSRLSNSCSLSPRR